MEDFEVVFVDDGSADGTWDTLTQLWHGDDRMRSHRMLPSGRGAALNVAMSKARSKICLINDVDDISLPSRLKQTLAYFGAHPASGCVRFTMFDDVRSLIMGGPVLPPRQRISLRCLLGMPVPFPSFAFRKSAFALPFRDDLVAGVDCDWISRNMRGGQIPDGHMLPIDVAYYRRHEQQITFTSRHVQREIALEAAYAAHAERIGSLSDDEKQIVRWFSGWDRLPGLKAFDQLRDYTGKLLLTYHLDDDEAAQFLLGRLAQLRGGVIVNDRKKALAKLKAVSKKRQGRRPRSEPSINHGTC